MSLSLLYKKPATKIEPVGMEAIELDATLSISPSYSSKVSRFPVEEGVDITDHISNEPVVLNLDGIVTDSPIKFLAGLRDDIAGISGGSRSKTAHDQLVELREKRLTFTLVTGLKTYTEMAFTSLEFPRDAGTGQALRIVASLQQVRKVESKAVKIPASKIKSTHVDQGASTVDLGKQATSEPDAQTGADASLALQGARSFGIFP